MQPSDIKRFFALPEKGGIAFFDGAKLLGSLLRSSGVGVGMKILLAALLIAFCSNQPVANAAQDSWGPIHWQCKRKIVGRPARILVVRALFLTTGLDDDLVCAKLEEKRQHCTKDLFGAFSVSDSAPDCSMVAGERGRS